MDPQREVLRERAKQVLRDLWAVLATTPAGPAELATNVTIEVPVGLWPPQRRIDSDDDILDFASQLQDLGPPNVLLLTADTGMLIRARARQIPAKQLRTQDLRDQPPKPSAKTPPA